MDAPLRLKPSARPQSPGQGFSDDRIGQPSDIQVKTEAVATQALQQINPQTPSSSQMQTFAIENFRFGMLTHTMDKSGMSQDFLREMLRYFVSMRLDVSPPIPTKRGDIIALECLFYQSLQKGNTLQAQACEAIMKSYFQNDPITCLASAYMACINHPPYEKARDTINAALHANTCYESLRLAAFLEKREGHLKHEILHHFQIGNLKSDYFIKFIATVTHQLDYVNALSELFDTVSYTKHSGNQLVKELQVLKLFLEGNYQKCLEVADRYLKRHPKSYNVQETKLRALVASGRMEEARAFVRGGLLLNLQLAYALIAKDKQTAYQYYIKFLSEAGEQEIPFWIILNFCEILEHVQIHSADTSVAIQRLQLESRMQPTSIPVHRGLYILFMAAVLEQKNRTPENLLAIKNIRVLLCLHDEARQHEYQLEYLKFLFKIDCGKTPEAQEAATQLCCLVSAKGLVGEFVSELMDLVGETTLGINAALEFSFNLYRQTQNVEHLHIHAKQLRDLGRKKEANGLFNEYVKNNPTSLRAILILLSFHLADHEDMEAFILCNCALKQFPDNLKLLSARGGLQFQFHLFEDVIRDLSIVMNHPEDSLQSHVRNNLFHSYLKLGLHRDAQAFLDKYGHQHIPKELIEEFRQQKARAKQEASRKKEKEPTPSPQLSIEPFPKIVIEMPEIAKDIHLPVSKAPEPAAVPAAASPEPVRNMEKKPPVHLQRLKHDVTSLDPKVKFKGDLNSLPKAFAGACTIDEEIYGKQSAPAPVVVKKETVDIPRVTTEELKRLERARLSIIAIGDLMKNAHVYCTPHATDPGNFLFPRNLAYQLLKFSDALVPTSLKQKDVRQMFKDVIQTHILSIDLIGKLRQAMRHEYHTVDMEKLKRFCLRLTSEKSTVQINIEAFLQAAPKDKSDTASVTFAARTNMERKQDLKKDTPVDYFEEVKHELTGMSRIADKFQLKQIDAENFYKDGLKMSICNIAECLRQLNVPEDKILQQFFRFGNRIAHEVGEKPSWYVAEEMDIHQLGMILNKAAVIKERIMNLVTHKEV